MTKKEERRFKRRIRQLKSGRGKKGVATEEDIKWAKSIVNQRKEIVNEVFKTGIAKTGEYIQEIKEDK